MNFTVLRMAFSLVVLNQQGNAEFNTHGKTPTSCESQPVLRGENAAITCHLGRDVNISKHDIDVQLYSPSGHHPVSVVKCNWLKQNPDEPTCSFHSGCKLIASASDTLTFEISNATKDFEGRYICQLVPSDGIPAHACNLTVKDGDSSQEKQDSRRNETVKSNTDFKLPEEAETQTNVFAIVLGNIVIVLVIIIIVLLFLWLQERKHRVSSSRTSSNQKPSRSIFLPVPTDSITSSTLI